MHSQGGHKEKFIEATRQIFEVLKVLQLKSAFSQHECYPLAILSPIPNI